MAAFPFPYLNHGAPDVDAMDKVDSLWIAFGKPVPAKARAEIEDTCPPPVAGFFKWTEQLFYCETPGDMYEYLINETYGDAAARESPYVSEAVAASWAAAVETWIREIHETMPVAFFIGPGCTAIEDPWDLWSCAQVMPVLIPLIEDAARQIKAAGTDGEDDEGDAEASGPMSLEGLAYITQHVDVALRRIKPSAADTKRVKALAKLF